MVVAVVVVVMVVAVVPGGAPWRSTHLRSKIRTQGGDPWRADPGGTNVWHLIMGPPGDGPPVTCLHSLIYSPK